eukprot:g26092.t1
MVRHGQLVIADSIINFQKLVVKYWRKKNLKAYDEILGEQGQGGGSIGGSRDHSTWARREAIAQDSLSTAAEIRIEPDEVTPFQLDSQGEIFKEH